MFLDTEEGEPAEMLYVKCGWVKVGVIPNCAPRTQGDYCTTAIFYKILSP